MEKLNLKIIFWNCKSLIQRLTELQSKRNTFDILICVESWLTPKDKIHLPGFVTFRKDRLHSRGGGTLIFIRSNLPYLEINDVYSPHQSVELCGIKLNHVNPALNLIICYRAPGITLEQEQWNTILKNTDRQHCLFVGDFNARNMYWNCTQTDKNGERLENSIEANNLFLHNDDTFTYINILQNYRSNLDLKFSTFDISDKINVRIHN